MAQLYSKTVYHRTTCLSMARSALSTITKLQNKPSICQQKDEERTVVYTVKLFVHEREWNVARWRLYTIEHCHISEISQTQQDKFIFVSFLNLWFYRHKLCVCMHEYVCACLCVCTDLKGQRNLSRGMMEISRGWRVQKGEDAE